MRSTHHLVLNVRFRVAKSTVRVKSCGKGPSISIYFACKLVSSGYAYSLNIAKCSCMVLRKKKIVNLMDFDIVDCSSCKFYTVIELLTNI